MVRASDELCAAWARTFSEARGCGRAGLVVAAIALAIASCATSSAPATTNAGEAGGGTPTTGGGGAGGATTTGSGGQDAGGAGGGPPTFEPTVTIAGRIAAYAPPVATHPGGFTFEGFVGDLEVCLYAEGGHCARSGYDGRYALDGVPARSDVALAFQHAAYGLTLLEYTTRAEDLRHDPALVRLALLDAYFDGSGCSAPPTQGTGTIFLGVPPGSRVHVEPTTPRAPAYTAADGRWDPYADRVDADTPPDLAAAVVCGLAPGEYQLDFLDTTGFCARVEGWAGTKGHDVRVLVGPDAITVVNWVCE